MNILLVTPYYSPDLGPSSPLLTMLCEDLAKNGYSISVICAVPHFPDGKVRKGYQNFIFKLSTEKGVEVNRVWVPSGNRNNLIHRAFSFLVFQVESAFLALFKKFDVAIITNPALETFLPFWIINTIRKKKIIYCVWDVYPEIGVLTGVMTNKYIIRLVKFIEDICLHRAQRIHILSEEFIPQLVKNHIVKEQNLVVRPIWVDVESFKPIPTPTQFLIDHGLQNKLVILYSGNIGLSQGLESIIETANFLRFDNEILFLFLGDGINKLPLQNQVTSLGLNNVLFLPFQTPENYREALSSAATCLVSLKPGIENESIPSKTYSIMAAGRSIIACADKNSNLANLIETADAGWVISNRNPQQMGEQIINIIHDQKALNQKASNARKYALHNFDRTSAAFFFKEQIDHL